MSTSAAIIAYYYMQSNNLIHAKLILSKPTSVENNSIY